MSETTRMRTFWLSVLVAIFMSAFGNWYSTQINITRIETMLSIIRDRSEENYLAIQDTNRRLVSDIVSLTSDRFRRVDWEMEEAKLDKRISVIEAANAETQKKINDIYLFIKRVE